MSNAFLDSENIPYVEYEDGQPCKHPGCVNHITHACEYCHRTGAAGVGFVISYQLQSSQKDKD